MTQDISHSVYDLSLALCVGWQAHSVSNAGNHGSNRLLPRSQLLADGTATDACSGNILKHYHATLLAEQLEAIDAPLCPACRRRDSRRAAALLDSPEYTTLSIERVLSECALCDAHGFLVTAKHAEEGKEETEARSRLSKHTLIDFSYALGLPEKNHRTDQVATRSGASKQEGLMVMKHTVRSGEYALCIRYHAVGVGADTERWQLVVTDEQERLTRHQAILRALRSSILSPAGALTATMLPHVTSLSGVIVICTTADRAPLYSALDPEFVSRLQALADETCEVIPFETVEAFSREMNQLIRHSAPARARSWKASLSKEGQGES